MKQIGLGLMQYMQDVDNRFPIVDPYGDGVYQLYANTGPFKGDGSFDRGAASQIWPNEVYPYIKNTQIFDCPSRIAKISGAGAPFCAYSVNMYLAYPNTTAGSQWCPTAPGGNTTCPMPDSNWAQPSQTFMLMEPSWTGYSYLYPYGGGNAASNGNWRVPAISNGPWQTAFDAQFGPGGWNVLPAAFDVGRHLSGCNICYADGHVKWTNDVSMFQTATAGWQSHWTASGK